MHVGVISSLDKLLRLSGGDVTSSLQILVGSVGMSVRAAAEHTVIAGFHSLAIGSEGGQAQLQ